MRASTVARRVKLRTNEQNVIANVVIPTQNHVKIKMNKQAKRITLNNSQRSLLANRANWRTVK